FGYYVWPFLLDGELVGRVDLKRTEGALHVVGAFTEDGQDRSRVAPALAAELQSMASWLGVGAVSVGDRGDLVGDLRRWV
ncbi:MAG: winged helix-turn-helix domain-containing protein, partial [Mycobacterium sp.]